MKCVGVGNEKKLKWMFGGVAKQSQTVVPVSPIKFKKKKSDTKKKELNLVSN